MTTDKMKQKLGDPPSLTRAAFSLDPSQFASTEQMDAYYTLYPEQVLYDSLQGGGGGGGGILPIQPARFAKLQGGRFGPRVSPWTFFTVTGWGPTARTAGLACTGVAAGCALSFAIFAAPASGPCFTVGCTAGIVIAAGANLRVRRR